MNEGYLSQEREGTGNMSLYTQYRKNARLQSSEESAEGEHSSLSLCSRFVTGVVEILAFLLPLSKLSAALSLPSDACSFSASSLSRREIEAFLSLQEVSSSLIS